MPASRVLRAAPAVTVVPSRGIAARWAWRHASTWLAAVLAACAAALANAADVEPSTLPQVRVVQPMHTAPIDQIRADARFERLVTTSSDKTLRIWRLSDLGLLRVVALPSEAGREGTPYAVAVSGDGRRIYAAGYTGRQWRGGSHIYVIDATSGRILGALARFEGEVITALDLSGDGKRLAVGLGRGGLVVIDPVSGGRLFADPQYAATVSFVHHAPDGRLATASSDGCLRVYAADGRLLKRNQYPPVAPDRPQCTGGALGGVRFSPDGRWLAVGDRVSPEVGIFDGNSLELRRRVRATDANQRTLCCVAWSRDSTALYVNGSFEGNLPTPLYVLHDLANGSLTRWNVGRQTITNMLPMPDGSLVFATTVPSLTRIDGAGQPMHRSDGSPLSVEPDNVDFCRTRDRPDAFLATADASSVAFELAPGHWLRASPLLPEAVDVLAPAEPGDARWHAAARTGGTSVEAKTGDLGYLEPVRVGSGTVELAFEESVQSWAVHGRLRIAALGTQWRLHLVDDHGRPLPGWENPPFEPARVCHTVITEDGRWVVAAIGDGTVRYYDVASGQERLGLFVHANGVDWVAWRPDGFYASSLQGDRYVGWLVNRGFAQSPDLLRAVQFERQLYRPDLVRVALHDRSNTGQSLRQLGQTLADLAPPRVMIESVRPTAGAGMVEIRFVADTTGRPLREVGVYVGGLPVLPAAQRLVAATEARHVARTVIARGSDAGADVRVEAETQASLGFDETQSVEVVPPVPPDGQGTLWVVAVGIEKFDSVAELRRLPLATNDAHDLAKALAPRPGRGFGEMRAAVLTEDSATPPTKANILARLRELEQMKPQDTAVVFLSSHGTTDSGDYYVATKDATAADIDAAARARESEPLAAGAVPSLLSGVELTTALRRLPGRRILILDTCHAGAAAIANPFSLMKRSASAQVAIMSASRGDEVSYDSPTLANSVFTGALIEVLAGRASPARGPLALRAAFEASGPLVQAQVREIQRRTPDAAQRHSIHQTPVLSAPPALEHSMLVVR